MRYPQRDATDCYPRFSVKRSHILDVQFYYAKFAVNIKNWHFKKMFGTKYSFLSRFLVYKILGKFAFSKFEEEKKVICEHCKNEIK